MFFNSTLILCGVVILAGSILVAYRLGQFISLYIKHGPHEETNKYIDRVRRNKIGEDGTQHSKLAKTVAEEVQRVLTMAGGSG